MDSQQASGTIVQIVINNKHKHGQGKGHSRFGPRPQSPSLDGWAWEGPCLPCIAHIHMRMTSHQASKRVCGQATPAGC